MAKSDTQRESEIRKRRPATTPEGREQQLTALAIDAMEARIRNGTASAQELTYCAKIGSPNARLERAILEQELELMRVKTAAIQSQERTEELYKNALSAMRTYSGNPEKETNDDY